MWFYYRVLYWVFNGVIKVFNGLIECCKEVYRVLLGFTLFYRVV